VILESTFRKYTSLFKQQGIPDAADEARVLICHVLKVDSAGFFAMFDKHLTDAEQSALSALAERRVSGEPSAYIVGHREFYGIDLFVDNRVLIPRPETELLVEEVLEYSRGKNAAPLYIADVGTGSGAIAIALALSLTNAAIFAIDISAAALEVAWRNVCRYGLQGRISLLKGNLLSLLPRPVDVVVANLPYIAEGDLQGLPVEVSCYEPDIALNGGGDGATVINRLLRQVRGKVNPGGIVLLEIGSGQQSKIFKMVKRVLPDSEIVLREDLAGIKRVVKIIVPCL